MNRQKKKTFVIYTQAMKKNAKSFDFNGWCAILIVDGGSITQWELAITPNSTISSKETEIDHESGSAPLTRVSVVRGTRSVRVRLATSTSMFARTNLFMQAVIFISLLWKHSWLK